jgi:uncharacterized coiled-coil DUF342 family protein
MELLSLRRMLEQDVPDPDEEKQILERIRDLERELQVT